MFSDFLNDSLGEGWPTFSDFLNTPFREGQLRFVVS